MKINKYFTKKIKLLLIIISIIMLLSIFITNQFLGIMKINGGTLTFGGLHISESNKTLDLYNDNIHIIGKIKAAYNSNTAIYFLYYYPFFILGNDKYQNVYDKYIINKNLRNFKYDPYYIVYNKKEGTFTYLNAQKKLIEGNIKDININYLKILDKSEIVSIDSIKFETSFNTINIKNKEYRKLLENLNQYLNLQINK